MLDKLILELRKVYKSFNRLPVIKDISFSVRKGEFFSLLGPSGAGKTTLLRIIAGLETPERGEVIIEGKVVADSKKSVPPEKRGISLVFQDLALFPHLTVYENVAFGLSSLKKKERDSRVQELLRMVGLEDKAKRFPCELSGGECQRVALARALAPYPRILLLDEPFSNLDKNLKEKIGEEVRKIVKSLGITTILVTHDQEEALVLSDRMGILSPEGRLEQVGTPREIYLEPESLFVARFLGKANLIRGRLMGGKFFSSIGVLKVDWAEPACEREVWLFIRPEDLYFEKDEKGSGIIKEIRFLGSDLQVFIEFPENTVLYALCRPKTFFYSEGDRVSVILEKSGYMFFDGKDGKRLAFREHMEQRKSI